VTSSPTRDSGWVGPPLRRRFNDPERELIRLLMISNQRSYGPAGLCEAYETMVSRGEIDSFDVVVPLMTALKSNEETARRELFEVARACRPNVVMVLSPSRLPLDSAWVTEFLATSGNPLVVYWEGDAWHRWRKPVNSLMRSWLAASDVVFSVAGRPQTSLFRRYGARDVRFAPSTYCHVKFAAGEQLGPSDDHAPKYDAVIVGNRWAHLGLVSRLDGASARARLVRRLERDGRLRLAVYGSGWRGRAAKGVLPFAQSVDAVREALVSANWDHFPRHESFVSDRLPTSLLAGRVHVATAHPGLEWLPGESEGLFLEPSVSAVVKRVQELLRRPVPELIELGSSAHEWVKHRLSDREGARFMLAAVDERLLAGLPQDPWRRFISGDVSF
jgi:hypothetical protein